MAWDSFADESERSVLKHHNRTLRTVNRKQREHLRELRDEREMVYRAICETETEAERAMRELWNRGDFICSPQDYDEIVETCVAALRYIAIPHEPHRGI